MKRLTLILLISLGASAAQASGKLTLQNNFYEIGDTKDIYRPMVGLSIYEQLMKKIYFNAWTGTGVQPLETADDVKWFITKAQLDVQFGKVTVSPGFQYKHLFGDSNSFARNQNMPFVALSYNLW